MMRLVALLMVFSGTAGFAQESRPASRPADGNPHVHLQTLLTNATEQLRSGKFSAEATFPLSHAAVEVHTRTLEGELETLPTRSDALGAIDVDLGERIVGTTISITVKDGETDYLAVPLKVGAPLPESIFCFRVTRTRDSLFQSVTRTSSRYA